MSILNATPRDRLVDASGRPYFLWDVDVTLDEFERRTRSDDAAVRAYWIGKLMRQARPDDVFTFVTVHELQSLRADVEPYLGQRRGFWHWLLDEWERRGVGR